MANKFILASLIWQVNELVGFWKCETGPVDGPAMDQWKIANWPTCVTDYMI